MVQLLFQPFPPSAGLDFSLIIRIIYDIFNFLNEKYSKCRIQTQYCMFWYYKKIIQNLITVNLIIHSLF